MANTDNALSNESDLTSAPGIVSRYSWADIDGSKWSKNFPYQLAIITTSPGGDGGYSIYQGKTFTLPVNPESLTYSTPFATTLSATLGGGVVEQNGGAPFRDITLQGSFGVLPGGRPTGDQLTGGLLHELGGLFGGTIAAAQRTATSAMSALLGPQFKPNTFSADSIGNTATGYYQFLQLQRFLESYAELKKAEAGIPLRLAFLVWKEDAAYLVAPKVFQVNKSKESPHEYRYTLQFQAWKRIDPNSLGFMSAIHATRDTARGPSVVATIFARIEAIQDTLKGAADTINAIKSDYDNTVGQFLREAALVIKDLQGLVKTVEDFPGSMKDAFWKDINDFNASIMASLTTKQSAAVKAKPSIDKAPEGSLVQGANGRPPQRKTTANLADPKVASALAAIKPDSIKLSDRTRNMMSAEVARVKNLTKEDYKARQTQTLAFTANFADKVGLGNATYNKTMGFPTAAQVREPGEDDYKILAALAETASVFGKMAGFVEEFKPKTPTNFESVAAVANSAGINMRVPTSKFAAPFPYGGSLERMAQQYLNDSKRWFEIATLNNLRAPYVDEVGVTVNLLINGSGSDVVIADASKLVLGQTVTLQSTTMNPVVRTILNTQKIAPGYWVVTLSGAGFTVYPKSEAARPGDMGDFQTGDTATVTYFERHTVHGGQLLYIPSDLPPSNNNPYAPNSDDLTQILKVGDVDGLLTDKGDIVILPCGDWPFVYGLQNLIQWTRTALNTPQGALLLHPNFGLPIKVGNTIADTSAADMIQSLKSMFSSNSAFSGIKSALVDNTGPVAKVSFELGVRGVDALVPILFDLS